MPIVLAVVAAGLALIVAIGAQNAFVLRQGVLRSHLAAVVGICIAGDVLLITLGTLGIGVVVERAPVMLSVLRLAGAAYLLWFAFTSFRAAARPQALQAASARSAGSVAGAALAITFLNPHVYLDTVVMLGSLANSYGPQRWFFSVGAMLGSVGWFSALGLGARLLSGPLGRPRVWRVIDIVIGLTMTVLALTLLLGLAG